jgi:lipopolysaccharide exporter
VSIGKEIAKGAAWMVLVKLLQRTLGFISTLILARLLVPEDFGLIAMAMSLVAILGLFTSFGLDLALIQNQAATTKHYDTAWTLNIVAGFISFIVLILMAYPTSLFYEDERLFVIIIILAIGVFIQSAENIGMVNFRKEMHFSKEFKFQLLKKISGFVVTVPLAFYLKSYWALIAGMITMNVSGFILSYILHEFRPKFSLSLWKELFHYSKWILLNNVFFFFKLRSTDFILGKMNGPHGLGLFNMSNEISALPTMELILPINRAIFPGYSKISNDISSLKRSYLNLLSVLAILTLPGALGISATASYLVPVLLGDNWLETIPFMELLPISGALVALQSNNGMIYLSIGKPRILTSISMCYALLLIPLLILFISTDGILGACYSLILVSFLFLIVDFTIMVKTVSIQPIKLFEIIYRPVISSAGMYFAVVQIQQTKMFLQQSIGTLIALVAVGVAVFIIISYLLWFLVGKPIGGELILVDSIKKKWQKDTK